MQPEIKPTFPLELLVVFWIYKMLRNAVLLIPSAILIDVLVYIKYSSAMLIPDHSIMKNTASMLNPSFAKLIPSSY